MLKHKFCSLAIVILIAGCSSGAKHTELLVLDRAKTTTPSHGGASSTGVSQVRVDPVLATGAGPEGVARIVYFDFDSYTIKPEYQAVIDGHARFLKAGSQRHVTIEGHTDERGGREYNLALGQRRSEAVRQALVTMGANENQIEAVSFGKERPAVQGTGEAVWAQNRRAEIVYR